MHFCDGRAALPFQVVIATLTACVSAGGQFGFQGYGRPYGDPLVGSATGGSFAAAQPIYPPQPYSFGYDSVDEFGTQTYRKEQGDASNAKKGSYGYRDAFGCSDASTTWPTSTDSVPTCTPTNPARRPEAAPTPCSTQSPAPPRLP
ncbi:hypothetical protein HPB49_019622 [Dermacentor silvarum]|uniref:Uncharacterized protein n=1 Tax=Dermacentor silvarum TaxID=543639 RepID=A0ACB8DFP5_DERSI|nr:hypothetical protein HPB49_019622 [Dermacentor silvarum]